MKFLLQMLHHMGDFPRKLKQHTHAVYDSMPCPPVGYPEIADEIWCHRYYLRNLCDQERFPDWPIVDHVPFLQVTLLDIITVLWVIDSFLEG